MIAWRTTTLHLGLLQPQRLACERCSSSYVRLAGEALSPTVVSALFGSNSKAHQRVVQKAEEEVARHGPLKKAGGLCPDCQLNPPPYSEPMPRRTAIREFSVGFGLIGLFLSGITALLVPDLRGPIVFVAAAAGTAFGAVIGTLMPLKPGPPLKPQRDRMSRTEAEWRDLEAECARGGFDPCKTWWYRDLGRLPVEEGALLSLPLHDWTLTAHG